ncbi:S-adenosyl-L-methionine-dependent methyltransferase [Aaosphaeria arxii CBS 175.79]|uniref:S-adenosyl-L-methionine-dependent methyltransferase n=1 Tax=Aaosphaeria arxii CBS 175.79 TaxID=1450172 RepID=A0A6A5XCH0_9PLEO|nr:S-adenosyl-L-methionine-dependent methyltransferase [Aaosphaeria arxii CBS 175.79]KAF2010609.1 S-adenosyl-L-methionine-dependent methyltransferase [Aaosphaeria arxii CBS 175.79]
MSTMMISLASSVTRYRYENGRRYHAFRDGQFYGPNDDKYASYEMVVHHLWLLTLDDKLFLAPIDDPEMILDVGTGTGLWAIDMADYFPSAEIIGTDLSPTQVTTAPPNIRFEVDDACSEWTYPRDSFDFVHVRGLTGCVRDWPYLYEQAYKHLKPGGYFEHLEFSIDTNADPNNPAHAHQMYTQFSNSILSLGDNRTGMTFRTIRHMKSYMLAAGFVDVEEHRFVWPIGPWPSDPHLKDMGRWGERNWADGIEGWVIALYTRVLGWTYEEVQGFVKEFRKVIKDRKNHFWHEVRCVYGRKPFPGEVVESGGKAEAEGGAAEV